MSPLFSLRLLRQQSDSIARRVFGGLFFSYLLRYVGTVRRAVMYAV